jgi:AraC-like DNA-binding protein
MEYLRTHLTDPELSVAQVARHHNISERYTYLILSKFKITFSDWVRQHRLQGAATDLLDPTFARDGISVIAFRWGFPDHANFTRTFTRHFGMSPRDFRRRATHE